MLRNLARRLASLLIGLCLLAVGVPLAYAWCTAEATPAKGGGLVMLVPLLGVGFVIAAFGRQAAPPAPAAGGVPGGLRAEDKPN